MPDAPSPPERGEGRSRRAFTALRYRDFRRFWIAALVSNSGTWVQGITVPFVLYALTGQALWVGLASFAQFVPFLLAGPCAGSLADRLPRRTLLLITYGISLA